MASEFQAAARASTLTDATTKGYAAEVVANGVAGLQNGDRAQLRRIYLTSRHQAVGIVIGLLHRAGVTLPASSHSFRPWKLLAHCSALLAGSGEKGAQPHSRSKQLGAVLHEVGLKEDRVLRLTSAKDSVLEALIIRTMRRVSQHGAGPVNLLTLFDLVSNNHDKSEAARLRIAQDYYAAKARSDKGDDE